MLRLLLAVSCRSRPRASGRECRFRAFSVVNAYLVMYKVGYIGWHSKHGGHVGPAYDT